MGFKFYRVLGCQGALNGPRALKTKAASLRRRIDSPPQIHRIWLWVYYSKIPTYPILEGDYNPKPSTRKRRQKVYGVGF